MVVPISAGVGIVGGGLLSVLLGLTTPQAAPPPQMNSRLDSQGPSLALLPLGGGQQLVLTTHF